MAPLPMASQSRFITIETSLQPSQAAVFYGFDRYLENLKRTEAIFAGEGEYLKIVAGNDLLDDPPEDLMGGTITAETLWEETMDTARSYEQMADALNSLIADARGVQQQMESATCGRDETLMKYAASLIDTLLVFEGQSVLAEDFKPESSEVYNGTFYALGQAVNIFPFLLQVDGCYEHLQKNSLRFPPDLLIRKSVPL